MTGSDFGALLPTGGMVLKVMFIAAALIAFGFGVAYVINFSPDCIHKWSRWQPVQTNNHGIHVIQGRFCEKCNFVEINYPK